MGDARVGLNGSGPQTAYVNVYRNSQDVGGNYSNYRSYGIYEGQGWGSWTSSTQYWSTSLGLSGTFTIPQPGTGSITLYDHWFNRYHDGNGYASDFNVSFSIDTNHSTIGDGTATAYEGYPPRIPKPPGKTPTPVFVSVTPTEINYTFSGPGDDGGSGITEYRHQVATNAGFSGAVQWVDNGSPGAATGLVPGTPHWIRYAAVNAYGQGPFSDALAQTTLPAVPPGFVVASSPSGSQATLTFSPPGGVTGVTKYTYERRATGTATPVTSKDSSVTVATETGLVPGNSYDWRASAWISGYQSPWTEWQTLVQAKPNTNPGDYFDGSTADVADLDYSWTGTANASTSVATAKGVAGWAAIFHTGAGVLYRVTAGIFAAYAARLQITADTVNWGDMEVGQSRTDPYWTEVTPGATYIGSIHVRPSRSQNMSAEVVWHNAAGTKLSASQGAGTVVAGGTWARVVAGGVAPTGAKWATVSAFDQQGTGWSKWLGGDTLDLDGAMISLNEQFPYFDGDTLTDGTYVYEWEGAANASQSTRTPIGQAQAQGGVLLGGRLLSAGRALTDPDCSVVPPPPRPPSVPSDCIDDIGVWRRYYTEIPANLVPDWIDVVPTIEVTSGALAARQVRIRYYANPDDEIPSEVDTSSWLSEQIISFMPAATVMTLDGVTQHVWAEIGANPPISADHLLYGTNGKPATWPVLSCGISYLVSIEVPIAEPAGNIVVAASLTART